MGSKWKPQEIADPKFPTLETTLLPSLTAFPAFNYYEGHKSLR